MSLLLAALQVCPPLRNPPVVSIAVAALRSLLLLPEDNSKLDFYLVLFRVGSAEGGMGIAEASQRVPVSLSEIQCSSWGQSAFTCANRSC